jgi:phage terminase large subunit
LTSSFKLTAKQQEAQTVFASGAKHILLVGGSRSGKTFLVVRNLVMRALKAPNSRHAMFRFRFNSIKSSVVLDTFPKVMREAFPGVAFKLDKTDWFAAFENGAQLWFGGLDDKDRTEKILGMEFATIALNECSQIPYASRNIALTRLAQQVDQAIEGRARSRSSRGCTTTRTRPRRRTGPISCSCARSIPRPSCRSPIPTSTSTAS